jgi:hypothetical protein
MRSIVRILIMFGVAVSATTPFEALAKEHASEPEADGIKVIAHRPVAGGPVLHLTMANHWRRTYLYLDQGGASPISILDVTNPATPKEMGQLDIPKGEADGDLSAVVGTVALLASPAAATPPQTVTIVNFADQEHPRVERQFAGVTAIVKQGEFVYLANGDGLWVLQLVPARDAELEAEYEKYVLYNH